MLSQLCFKFWCFINQFYELFLASTYVILDLISPLICFLQAFFQLSSRFCLIFGCNLPFQFLFGFLFLFLLFLFLLQIFFLWKCVLFNVVICVNSRPLSFVFLNVVTDDRKWKIISSSLPNFLKAKVGAKIKNCVPLHGIFGADVREFGCWLLVIHLAHGWMPQNNCF